MRKTFLLAIVLALAIAAQTKPKLSQVQGPTATAMQLLGLINGRIALVALGSGVQVVQVGSGYEIRASSVAPTRTRLTRATDGSWTVPSGCTLTAAYRNGLLQWPGQDYGVTGTALRFTDGSIDPSESDDIVIAECK